MGEIIGGMIALYAVGKLLEWIILKRVMLNFPRMAFMSSALVFVGIVILWAANSDKPYAFHPAMLVSYFIASLILPFARVLFFRKRMLKAAATSAATQ